MLRIGVLDFKNGGRRPPTPLPRFAGQDIRSVHKVPADGDNQTLARTAKALGIAAFAVAMLGLVGAAYCEYRARQAPLHPDIDSGQTYPIDYKGRARYVGKLDAQIEAVSFLTIFVAAVIGLVLNGFYIWIFRRFP